MKPKQIHHKIAWVTATIMMASVLLMPFSEAHAAQITSLSDTLSRLKDSVNANHELFMVLPGGIAAGKALTLTFSGFVGSSVNAIVFGDVDFATGSSGTCSSATYTEQTLAGSPSGATWGVSAGSSAIVITSGTGTSTAGNCVRVRIGTNATTGGTGTHQITNGTAATDHTVVASTNITSPDSGTLDIDIITDDQVTISATVTPTITFTIDTNSISFGTLSSSTGRWATSGGGANATAATLPSAGNTLTVATNAASGYVLTYNGATLTSGGGATITATSISSDSDGAPGSSQFAMTASTSGAGSVTAGYARSTNSSWNFVPSTTTTLLTNGAPTNTETITISYLANIPGAQAAGAYSTTLTYIATGTF